MAHQVLRRVTKDMIDMREHWSEGFEGVDIRIHLDNARHANGIQRLWTCCPDPNHAPCFKHRQVDQFSSKEEGILWMAAWVWRVCDTSPHRLNKGEHMLYEPDSDVIRKLRGTCIYQIRD